MFQPSAIFERGESLFAVCRAFFFIVIFSYNVCMSGRSDSFLLAVLILLIVIFSSGCAGGRLLRTQEVQRDERITGMYSLILFHNADYDGLKTIAFLGAEGTGYSLVPYAPFLDYTVSPNITGQEAIRRALIFISDNPLYKSYEISRILDTMGKTVGYEVRPLYNVLAHGVSDVMTVSYSLRDGGVVQIHIELDQRVINDFTD